MKKIQDRKKARIYDPALTLTITDKIINYDLKKDKKSIYDHKVTKTQKVGYIARDENNEELGIVFESDDKRTKRYQSAEILFFNEYTEKHHVGTWRVIQPTDIYGVSVPNHLMADKYIVFDLLKKELIKKSSLIVTTCERRHITSEDNNLRKSMIPGAPPIGERYGKKSTFDVAVKYVITIRSKNLDKKFFFKSYSKDKKIHLTYKKDEAQVFTDEEATMLCNRLREKYKNCIIGKMKI